MKGSTLKVFESSNGKIKEKRKDYFIQIGGFVPLSTIDYPDSLSAIIFCQGCPWDCYYCHNSHLRDLEPSASLFDWEEILEKLTQRKNFLDAVVFSGGEPLLQKNLKQGISTMKALGYKVGLHTTGFSFSRFKEVFDLVDWFGVDVKYVLEEYSFVIQGDLQVSEVINSLDYLLKSKKDYQLRFTYDRAKMPEQTEIISRIKNSFQENNLDFDFTKLKIQVKR